MIKTAWKYTAEYGEECCSLHDSYITSAQLENGILTLYFKDGIMLLPNTRANESADTVYRSTAAAVKIELYDVSQHIPEPVEIEIKGPMYLFGKYIGRHSRYISLQELIDDINAHSDKYETLYVYSSEADNWTILIQGAVHEERKRRIFFKLDNSFELLLFKKTGTRMRFFWDELNKEHPI